MELPRGALLVLVETSMAIAAPRAATVERVPRFVAVVVKKDMESARKGWGRSCRARYGSSLN